MIKLVLHPWLRSAAACALLLPAISIAAGRPPPPPAPVSRCESYGTIGVDYPWPDYSDSYAVNKFRNQIVFALKSMHGFEGPEEESVPIGDPSHPIALPKGWLIMMDAYPGGYSVAVAIPPKDGPFADPVALRVLLEEKDSIFGRGGSVSYPGNPNETNGGVRLPCTPNDPDLRAPAIILGIPYKGEEGEPM